MTDYPLASYSTPTYSGPLGLVGQPDTGATEGRSEPCACGGIIVVMVGDLMPLRVRVHVESEPHYTWSRERER